MKMRVAIVNITAGGMSGGYREYLRNIIPRMAAHNDVESILCAAPGSLNIQDWFDVIANVKFIDCKSFRFLNSIHDHTLNKELKSFRPHVIYVPVERYFKFKDIPVVNMFQNMEPFATGVEENSFVDKVRHWIQRLHGKRATTKADRVIAISKFVADFLAMNWNIPKDRISLVYHGVDIKRDEDDQRPGIIPDGWDNKFIFTAGSICPARGLRDVLQTMRQLSACGGESVRLVIAGETGHRNTGYQKKLKEWAEKNNVLDKICWTGGLDKKEMTWCYKKCIAFVMTSRVESFGMVAGEAMAHGCICISADNPCLPEIFGDTAIYYPPRDSKALAKRIETVLTLGEKQRNEASERARKRASKFSWDVCAERTVRELAKAANRESHL